MKSPNVMAEWIITTIINRGGVRLSSLFVASRNAVIDIRIPYRMRRFSALPPTQRSSSSCRKTSHQTGRSDRAVASAALIGDVAAVMRSPPR
jgi:hypothetical protein